MRYSEILAAQAKDNGPATSIGGKGDEEYWQEMLPGLRVLPSSPVVLMEARRCVSGKRLSTLLMGCHAVNFQIILWYAVPIVNRQIMPSPLKFRRLPGAPWLRARE